MELSWDDGVALEYSSQPKIGIGTEQRTLRPERATGPVLHILARILAPRDLFKCLGKPVHFILGIIAPKTRPYQTGQVRFGTVLHLLLV